MTNSQTIHCHTVTLSHCPTVQPRVIILRESGSLAQQRNLRQLPHRAGEKGKLSGTHLKGTLVPSWWSAALP